MLLSPPEKSGKLMWSGRWSPWIETKGFEMNQGFGMNGRSEGIPVVI